ncbi:MAG: type III-A CRISPR-associated protein Csm2 [Desulfurobacteriaceae bacterium]
MERRNQSFDFKVKDLLEKYFKGNSVEKATILGNEFFEFVQKLKKEKVSKHQIRKHYHYLLEILEKIEADDDRERAFLLNLPKIAMAKVYINYDASRNMKSKLFKEFVEKLVDKVVNTKSLQTFKDAVFIFEALVGYTADLRR